jgi:hypothetical protein
MPWPSRSWIAPVLALSQVPREPPQRRFLVLGRASFGVQLHELRRLGHLQGAALEYGNGQNAIREGFGRQCTMDPPSVPVLTPVVWSRVLSSVKLPVAPAKRPVPPVMV